MSSESLNSQINSSFLWSGGDLSDYVLATYRIRTQVDGDIAAVGIAREQSLCADALPGWVLPADIDRFRAKVISVEPVDALSVEAPLYYLNTPVYGAPSGADRYYRIVIAYPGCAFDGRLTRLWNAIFGEVHRLGYLSGACLEHIEFPDTLASAFKGPRYGITGIRERLGIRNRPLFCRSMRPAMGLSTDMMVELNRAVLSGGFDCIKDDELTYDNRCSPFADRVRRMVDMKRRVEDETGEQKFYFANILDDLPYSLDLADQAAELGADGVLMSPFVQGLSIISEVARRTNLVILSHNSCGDVYNRVPGWGASHQVMALIQRAAGADLVVSPGPFATPWQAAEEAQMFLAACRQPTGTWGQSMPIMQGGKKPEFLKDYVEACGSTDFMIIAATWVDEHAQGIQQGARAFREAWEQVQL